MDDHTVIGRAMAIIDATLDADQPISLAQLSRLTQIPKPTVRRIANTLAGRGLLTRNAVGYAPGQRLITAGNRAAERQGIRMVSAPYLQELFERAGGFIWLIETTSLDHLTLVTSVYDHTAVLYSNDWPRNFDEPGIIASALGQVVLAGHPDRVEGLLQRGIPRLTRHTPIQPRHVLAALARATSEGLAVEHEQMLLGWSCLAIPVAGPGADHAVLGVVDRTARFDAGKLRRAALTAAGGIGKEWRLSGEDARSQLRGAPVNVNELRGYTWG